MIIYNEAIQHSSTNQYHAGWLYVIFRRNYVPHLCLLARYDEIPEITFPQQ